MLNADALVARHGVCFVLRSPEVGDVGGVDLVLIEQVDGGVLIADAVVMGAAVGLEHGWVRDRHAVVCCAYYSRSDPRATRVVTTLPIVCLILDQLDASMDALPKVVCESDADSNGEGDGEELLHGRISDGRKCSRRPKWR